MRCASSAGSLSPVSARPSARARPTSRGSSQVPPQSGISPIFEKAWMKLALRAATTMSQPSAKLAPAPAATPLTAAITGTGIERDAQRQRRVVALDHRATSGGAPSGEPCPGRSGPARRRNRGRRR